MDLDNLSALLGEDVSAETHADLWVVAPDGETGARLVAEARRLADGLGCYVHAVANTEAAAPGLFAAGADRVHVTADAVQYLAAQQPEFVLFDAAREAEAAQFAQRAGAGLITNARDLSVEEGSRALLGAHPVYGDEYSHTLAVTTPVKVATVVSADLPEPYADPGRSGEVVTDESAATNTAVRDLGPADYHPPIWRPLSKARVIVAAGRGLRDDEGFALARQLAEVIGAELAGDRSALASGWVDEAHEVGVTGQEVAPDLYLAVGILGDTMHNAAITGARRVIAVHANAEAPIFGAADVAVVAEPKAWVRLVLAALQ